MAHVELIRLLLTEGNTQLTIIGSLGSQANSAPEYRRVGGGRLYGGSVEATTAMVGEAPVIDIALDIRLDASAARVFAALTQETGAWWSRRFLRAAATGLRLEPHLGGLLIEHWVDGGAVLATVTGFGQDRLLQLSGAFHLGCGLGLAEFVIVDGGRSVMLEFSFRAFGPIDPAIAEQFGHGWRDLVTVNLKAFVESGTRLGIDAELHGASGARSEGT